MARATTRKARKARKRADRTRSTPQAAEWPPIPSAVPSALGPIPVTFEVLPYGETHTTWGRWEPAERRIYLRPGMDPAHTWATLMHEVVHAEIDDAGLKLPEDTEEAICRALGPARALKVRTGWPG